MRSRLLVVPLLLAGCAPVAGDSGSPWGPVSVETDEGHFVLDLALDPDPPVVGASRLLIDTTDAAGERVGAELVLTPWMPAHGHGTAEPPVFQALDGGGTSASFSWSMPGSWELRFEISHDGVDDTLDVPVEVQ